MNDTIVITGAGLVCSLGQSPGEVWDALVSGKTGIGPIRSFDARGFGCRAAAQASAVSPAPKGIQPKLARMMDKHLPMLLLAATDAHAMGGVPGASIPPGDIGFFAGMGMIDYEVEDLILSVLKSSDSARNLDYDLFYADGYQEIYPLWPLSMLDNVAFCQVSINLDVQGENAVFCPHADSGAQAVAEGVKAVLNGRARMVLAGGVSEKVSPMSLARAHRFGIVNISEDEGKASLCRPFSSERCGTILGEGCGMVLMESASSAASRHAAPLAAISGFGFACEREKGAFAPTAGAVASAMQSALGCAGLDPSDIGAVIAHGDGTLTGDRNEAEAICSVFSGSIGDLGVFSSKGALGHMFAGAPGVDLVLAIEMIRRGEIPPTLNAPPLDAGARFHVASSVPSPLGKRRILVNSSSYEGQCASIVIESVS
jgi:3-oxoacyl-[acyl-carrier-protein] synthase II